LNGCRGEWAAGFDRWLAVLRGMLLCIVLAVVGGGGVEAERPLSPPTPTPPTIPTSQPTPFPEPTPSVSAANADVLFVRATETSPHVWTFSVTVAHPDSGWEDYANGWDVLLPNGTVLLPDADSSFTRLLLHPHENEQPFTRSQSNIVIPADVTEVRVRAHDLVHGFGGKEVVVDLTAVSTDQFETVPIQP
jgi:hypothetical protein